MPIMTPLTARKALDPDPVEGQETMGPSVLRKGPPLIPIKYSLIRRGSISGEIMENRAGLSS